MGLVNLPFGHCFVAHAVRFSFCYAGVPVSVFISFASFFLPFDCLYACIFKCFSLNVHFSARWCLLHAPASHQLHLCSLLGWQRTNKKQMKMELDVEIWSP